MAHSEKNSTFSVRSLARKKLGSMLGYDEVPERDITPRVPEKLSRRKDEKRVSVENQQSPLPESLIPGNGRKSPRKQPRGSRDQNRPENQTNLLDVASSTEQLPQPVATDTTMSRELDRADNAPERADSPSLHAPMVDDRAQYENSVAYGSTQYTHPYATDQHGTGGWLQRQRDSFRPKPHSNYNEPVDYYDSDVSRIIKGLRDAAWDASKRGNLPSKPTAIAEIDRAVHDIVKYMVNGEVSSIADRLDRASNRAGERVKVPKRITGIGSIDGPIDHITDAAQSIQRREIADNLRTALKRAAKRKDIGDVTSHPELDSPLNSLIAEMQGHEWEKRENAMRDNHARAIQAEISKYKREYTTLETSMKNSQARLDTENSILRGKYETEKTGRARESGAYFKEKSRLEENLSLLEQKYNRDMDRRDADHAARINELRRQHQDKVLSLQATEGNLKDKLLNLQRDQDAVIEKVHAQYRIELEAQRTKMLDAREKWERNKQSWELALQQKDQDHTARELELKDLLKKEKDDMTKRHKQELKKWIQRFEDMKSDLTVRDHFKGMGDDQVATQFGNLTGEVDDLSRLSWESSKKSTWFYPDRVLRNSDNVRKIKQHILLDKMWTILFDNIFSTPFEVFGDEGRRHEQAWVQKFGTDQTSRDFPDWPKATEPSEKWRYEKIAELKESVDRGQSSAFNDVVKATTREIGKEFEKVADLGKDTVDQIHSAVENAGKIWLEFGLQRCRLLIVLPNSTSRSKNEKELVIKPEIRRVGDAGGASLDQEEVIRNGAGESRTFNVS